METTSSKPRHPVRVVAQRTGLTPATLRAWERRYGVVSPGRSAGGQRLYSDADVERLTVLRQLTDGGRSIGRVAELTAGEARALLEEDLRASPASAAASPAGDSRSLLSQAVEATRAMDAEGLRVLLRRAAVTLGVNAFLDELVAPFLHTLGDGWVKGDIKPAQEHLASEVVEEVLAWLSEPAGSAGRPGLVVATLPGELHRLGARLVAAVAVFEGWRVSYLGADLPGREIGRAAEAVEAKAVAVSVVAERPTSQAFTALQELEAEVGRDTPVLLGGQGAAALAAQADVGHARLVEGLDGLREALRSLG